MSGTADPAPLGNHCPRNSHTCAANRRALEAALAARGAPGHSLRSTVRGAVKVVWPRHVNIGSLVKGRNWTYGKYRQIMSNQKSKLRSDTYHDVT